MIKKVVCGKTLEVRHGSISDVSAAACVVVNQRCSYLVDRFVGCLHYLISQFQYGIPKIQKSEILDYIDGIAIEKLHEELWFWNSGHNSMHALTNWNNIYENDAIDVLQRLELKHQSIKTNLKYIINVPTFSDGSALHVAVNKQNYKLASEFCIVGADYLFPQNLASYKIEKGRLEPINKCKAKISGVEYGHNLMTPLDLAVMNDDFDKIQVCLVYRQRQSEISPLLIAYYCSKESSRTANILNILNHSLLSTAQDLTMLLEYAQRDGDHYLRDQIISHARVEEIATDILCRQIMYLIFDNKEATVIAVLEILKKRLGKDPYSSSSSIHLPSLPYAPLIICAINYAIWYK